MKYSSSWLLIRLKLIKVQQHSIKFKFLPELRSRLKTLEMIQKIMKEENRIEKKTFSKNRQKFRDRRNYTVHDNSLLYIMLCNRLLSCAHLKANNNFETPNGHDNVRKIEKSVWQNFMPQSSCSNGAQSHEFRFIKYFHNICHMFVSFLTMCVSSL